MKIEELLAKLETNASAAVKPVSVEIEGVGSIHVRRRTVLEFEQMASLNDKRKEGSGQDKDRSLFAASLARLLCDEEGRRYPPEHENALAQLLAQQPETVFHAIIAASDGSAKPIPEGAVVPN